jgi:SAM-dependent methyltransferase
LRLVPPERPDRAFTARQRLAFGAVAEIYDRARPAYPAAAIDGLFAHAGLTDGDVVLEVGAGTGTATRQLAERGLGVVAVEPSAEMAAVGARSCAPYGAVGFVIAEFERWTPPRRFPALVSANAWHWIDADSRYALAAAALQPGGTLACLWTLPDWSRCSLRDELRAVYASAAPELEPRFPMHPGSDPGELAGDWAAEIAAAGELFTEPRIEWVHWSVTRSADAYVELLGTHQDHILERPGRRDALMAAVADTIDRSGAPITLPTTTRLCLAQRR